MMAPFPQIKVQIYTSKKLHEFQKHKCKETHVKTHYSQFIKSKGQRVLESAKEQQVIIYKESPTKLTAECLPTTMEAR